MKNKRVWVQMFLVNMATESAIKSDKGHDDRVGDRTPLGVAQDGQFT